MRNRRHIFDDGDFQADGLQRDGAHVREPVDAMLRAALQRGGIPWQMVYGTGRERLAQALRAVNLPDRHSRESGNPVADQPWIWLCDKCSDPVCEHRLFSSLVNQARTG